MGTAAAAAPSAAVEKAGLSFTAHSEDLYRRLKENYGESLAVVWIEDHQKELQEELDRFNLVLSEAEDKGSTISILVPVTPTFMGPFAGHHQTYTALKALRGSLETEDFLVSIEAIFLDHRASLWMRDNPIHDRYSTALNHYRIRIKEIRKILSLRPDYMDDHLYTFNGYHDPGDAVKAGKIPATVEHMMESQLFGDLANNPWWSQILRQSAGMYQQLGDPEVLESEVPVGFNWWAEENRPGIDLTSDSLNTVLLHAARMGGRHDGVYNRLPIIFCGGDMFMEIRRIRRRLVQAFPSACAVLDKVPIICTPLSKGIMYASKSLKIPAWMEESAAASDHGLLEKVPIEDLVVRGMLSQLESLGGTTDDWMANVLMDQGDFHVGEVRILLGREKDDDDAVVIDPRDRGFTVSDVDDLKKVSKLTKKSLLVLKVIRGDDPEQPVSKSELTRILTNPAREDDYRLSRRGLDLVLQNLLDLHLIIETNDGSYRFGSSDIIIPLDLLMEQLTEGG